MTQTDTPPQGSTSLRDKLIGETIGGCQVEALLGGGAMGYVFRATHLALDKTVALKVLTPELAEHQTLRERFELEARIASAIEHPNVAPVYGVGLDRGYHYIVMRSYDGASLARVLSRQGIEPLMAAKIGENVASALAAIHQAGYVHRDVKPENILLTERGLAVLTDFGVASAIGTADPPGRGGSPAYMSPEQCRGEPVDGRSDLYSLGVTMYQALTGRRPFLGATRPALLLMHQQDEFPPVEALRPGTLPTLVAHVHRLLEKIPARRFQTAGEARDAMRDVQEELRALRRRDTMTIQMRGPTASDSAIFGPVGERDTEEVELDEVAEDVELGLLSLEGGEASAFASGAGSSLRHERAAREALARERYDQAMTRISRAIELRVNDGNLYVTRGNIFRKTGDLEAAIADYRKALELAPDNRRALTALGSLLSSLGKAREAEEYLKRALSLDAGNVEARIALGKIYERAGASGLARKQYQKAIEMVRADERGYVALASLLIAQKQHGAAKGFLGTARELNPSFAPTLFWLAVVFAAEQNWRAAIETLEAAVKAGLKDRSRLMTVEEFKPLHEHPRFVALMGIFGS